jgi:hypothetical protein
VYRSLDAVRGAAIATIFAIVFVVLAVLPGRTEIPAIIWTPIWVIGTWRAWQRGVHLGKGGVTVVGLLATKRIPWTDIERFALMPAGRYPNVGHVVRSNGRPAVPVLAILASRDRPEDAQRTIDTLNDELAKHRVA